MPTDGIGTININLVSFVFIYQLLKWNENTDEFLYEILFIQE